MGNQGFREIVHQYRNKILPANSPETVVVTEVVQKLLSANNLHHLQKWEVFVIQSKELNAFVLPNGKIFVFTGILPIMKNKDGIAAVLGHEIAHVTNRHSAEKLSLVSFLQFMRFGFMLVGLEPPGFLSSLLLNFGLLLPNSRACESEADQVGLEYMSKACFNPEEAVELWKRMKVLEKQSSTSEFASTHPSHDHRITDLAKWMGQAKGTRNSSNCDEFGQFAAAASIRHW